MARQLVLAIAFGAFATAAAQSPPPIGTHYSTTVAMNQDGVVSLGRLYATGDWTLFEQSSPKTAFPFQLNLCNHGSR
jgi:hypothetical protein